MDLSRTNNRSVTTQGHLSVALGSSPSQSTMLFHSVPSHVMNRSELLAMQDAYYSNPQLDEQFKPASGVVDSLSLSNTFVNSPPPITTPNNAAHDSAYSSLPAAQQQQQLLLQQQQQHQQQQNQHHHHKHHSHRHSTAHRYSRHEDDRVTSQFSRADLDYDDGTYDERNTHSPSSYVYDEGHFSLISEPNIRRIDPTPLLSDSLEREPSLSTLASPTSFIPPIANPHKPLRRWLFDFPPRLNQFFYRFDTYITRIVQKPLATVGGLTTSLEEEILQHEMTNQQRKEEERRRMMMGKYNSQNGKHKHIVTPASNSDASLSLNAEKLRAMSDASVTSMTSDNGTSDNSQAPNSPPAVGLMRHNSNAMMPTVLRRSLAITTCNKLMVAFALLFSAFTTIEIGVFFPIFLFLCGWDELGTLQLMMTTVAAIISQVFKRFVFRPRPWMSGRSLMVKKDKTSSFPSRAVLCAVIYAYGFAHLFYPPHDVPPYVYLTVTVGFALLASISRIFVGAHYASDCLAGFILGACFVLAGSGTNKLIEHQCGGCYFQMAGSCYAQTPETALKAFTQFTDLQLSTLFWLSGISVVVVGAAMSGPLHFWTKCIPIFGILFPCFAFRLVMLCPGHNSTGVALLRVTDRTPLDVFLALLISAVALGFAKLLSKLTWIDSVVQLTTSEIESGSSEGRDNSVSPSSSRKATNPEAINLGNDASLEQAALGHTTAASKHLLQWSSFKTMLWNIFLFLFAYAAVFLVLFVWRVFYVRTRDAL